MNNSVKISRRNLLIAMGMLGAGGAACLCGGTATAGLLLLSQQSATDFPTAIPSTASPIPAPRFVMPPTVSRSSWGALPPNHNAENENGFYSEDNLEGWRIYDGEIDDAYQTVIIHHSAFYENNDLDTLLEVQASHRNQRGWADIGYHFLVGKNGLIYEGRDWYVRGTHVETFNTGSFGVCLLGNFMIEDPTIAQLESTLALVNWAAERLRLTHIATHRDFNPLTECPGDHLYFYLDQFAEASGLIIGTDGYIPPDEAAACFCCACSRVM